MTSPWRHPILRLYVLCRISHGLSILCQIIPDEGHALTAERTDDHEIMRRIFLRHRWSWTNRSTLGQAETSNRQYEARTPLRTAQMDVTSITRYALAPLEHTCTYCTRNWKRTLCMKIQWITPQICTSFYSMHNFMHLYLATYIHYVARDNSLWQSKPEKQWRKT